jgi:isopentenyl diphosphate isomerase/L-lactate dehydrogenase-like FMN-dependent dehydrogenase
VLRAAGAVDPATTFLGIRLPVPVMLAPVGGVEIAHPDGALAAARAAARFGTVTFVATSASPSLKELQAAAVGPLVFQLSMLGDRRWAGDMLRQAEDAGCVAICVTADVTVVARRERVLNLRMFPAGRRDATRPNVLPSEDLGREGLFSWDDLAWLRSASKLPLILKGVQCAEDAEIAIQHGVDVVYVSNHGGRQLDHAPATIDVLSEVVAATGGSTPVIVDGGFVRGSDVVKALALGAQAVLIGKLMMWGLAAGGPLALERTLELLAEEMRVTMSLIGARDVSEITGSSIRSSVPPHPNPWPVGPGPTLGSAIQSSAPNDD